MGEWTMFLGTVKHPALSISTEETESHCEEKEDGEEEKGEKGRNKKKKKKLTFIIDIRDLLCVSTW